MALLLATLGMATLSFGRTRIGDWTLGDLLFALAGVAVLIERLGPARRSHNARSATLSPMVLGTGLLLTAATLSSLVAVDPWGSMAVVLRFLWLTLIWLWILQAVAPTVRDFNVLVRGLRWTVLISSTVAIGGYLGVLNFSQTINETRETGLYDHPNHLGAMLIAGLPFLILDAPTPPSGPRSVAWRVGLTGYTLFAVMTTGSLTTVVGVVVVMVTLVVTMTLTRGSTGRRSNPFMKLMGLFAIALAAGYFLQSSTPATERFQSLGNEDSGTAESARSRAGHADAVMSNIDDLLVVGVGLDSESARINLSDASNAQGDVDDVAGDEVHNVYLKLLHNAGLPALIGFVILTVTALRNGWLLVLHSRGREVYTTAVALVASLVAINVVAQFRTPIYQRYFWVTFVLIGTLWVAYRNDIRRANDLEAAEGLSGEQGPIDRRPVKSQMPGSAAGGSLLGGAATGPR